MTMGCGCLEYVSIYMSSTETNQIDAAINGSKKFGLEKNEGLIKGCTSKGNRAKHGGNVTRVFVAISLSKWICYCKQYEKHSSKLLSNL